MGHRNLSAARWAGRVLRSANAVKALNEMAYVSMDADVPPLYWGGWERLAIAIGYDVPAEPDPSDSGPAAIRARARRKTAMNAAGAATKALAEVGLIRLARAEAPGRNSEWSLDLSLANGPAKSGSERSREVRDDGPGNPGTTVPRSPGPEEVQEVIRRTGTDDTTPFVRKVQPARETEAPEDEAMVHTDFARIHGFLDDGNGYCAGCALPEPSRRHYGSRSA